MSDFQSIVKPFFATKLFSFQLLSEIFFFFFFKWCQCQSDIKYFQFYAVQTFRYNAGSSTNDVTCQFHQHSTSSLCARRSQKRKKDWQLDCLFCAFRIHACKGACRMLMKLTPGWYEWGVYILHYQQNCQFSMLSSQYFHLVKLYACLFLRVHITVIVILSLTTLHYYLLFLLVNNTSCICTFAYFHMKFHVCPTRIFHYCTCFFKFDHFSVSPWMIAR